MVWLNGILLPEPSGISHGVYDITKAERASNGLMNIEFIARKRTVKLEYKLISDAALAAIMSNLHSRVLHTLRYIDAGAERTITVYHGDRNYAAFYTDRAGVRWWKEAGVTLIER